MKTYPGKQNLLNMKVRQQEIENASEYFKDVALHPREQAKDILNFVQLDYQQSIDDFISNNTWLARYSS